MTAQLHSVPATPPRAVLYLRQSVSHDDSVSLALQESAGREYCRRQGYTVAAVLADPDRTGRTWRRRPAVAQALALVEDQRADLIVLWKWSRLSRNRRDWAVAQDRVEVAGGRIESATEPVDTTTAAGRFQRGVLVEMAAFESERIGEVWREVHQRRVQAGLPATGKPRWGYVYDPVTKTFSPDSVLGPVLRDLYQRYTAGEPALDLVDWLNGQDIRTSTGGRWQLRTLLRMMDTGFGAGLLTWRGDRLPGVHQPVITPTEWAAYQARRAERRSTPSRTKGSIYPLSGLVVCARCGGAMYPGSYRDGQVQYRCSTPTKRGRSACRGGYVSAAHLAASVREWLATLVADVDQLAALTTPRPPEPTTAVDTRRLRREVARVDAALGRLTTAWALGNLGEAELAAARAELVQQRDQAAQLLAAADAQVEAPGRPGVGVYRSLLAGWDTMDAAARRDACRVVIRQVRVVTGRPRGVVAVVPRWADPGVG